MSEYIKDDSVEEEGPWHLYFDKGRVTGIGSHDFAHDVMFGISGDFGSAEDKMRYANEIVRRLNAYGRSVEPSQAAHTHEALRTLVELLDRRIDISEAEFLERERRALIDARLALQGRSGTRLR
jgi:hypothetical protein